MLRRFLPCLPWNCTSTNSVSCTISLLRMTPSPNLSWRTLSPGLNCWPFGLAGIEGTFDDDSGGVTLLLLFCGSDAMCDEVGGVHCVASLFPGGLFEPTPPAGYRPEWRP